MPEEFELAYSDESELARVIRQAIGAGDYETVKAVCSPHEREDGRKVYYFPRTVEEFDNLKKAPHELLIDIGLGLWDGDEENMTWTHYLYPYEWYDCIPEGYMITNIFDEDLPFQNGKTPREKRLGCLPYGFIVGKKPEEGGKHEEL